ncbi:hypothetical protein RUM44_009235 [Polyplax serrata]|uniref:Alpha-mannosidase n=1 Tax=Polyplax serrata TaxID=468196 RepID=A0ABR1AS42_POLSC
MTPTKSCSLFWNRGRTANVGFNFPFTARNEWLNIHLVPHSHDDVGWLKTPEDYYDTTVRYILDNIVFELKKNALRRFVYAEIYFFSKWWDDQKDETKEDVKTLLKRKQLEIIGGGFCMSDEAVTHYQSFIDQSTWGFRFINETFGPEICPTAAWQIDTFGHSKGIASLLAQMGFDSLFFARMDLIDKKYRKQKKELEFIWWGNENLGESSSLFTSIFFDHYSAPKGFDFEYQRMESNIDFEGFAKYMRYQAKSFKTNNIFVPMGDDFRFLNAKGYFDKLDKLVGFFNKNPSYKLNVFYSTPSIYIDYLKETKLVWPEKEGDFFPYAAEFNAYWTGFFTSRPTLKYFERVSNNFLQITKQLLVIANTGLEYFEELTNLREAVAIVQHHDAITGTAQQHVTNHYTKLMHDGIHTCSKPVDNVLGYLSFINSTTFPRPKYKSCLLLNISSCDVTESSPRFVVTVYNPLSRQVDRYVRVPVTDLNFAVLERDGTVLTSQIVAIPTAVRNIPGRQSTSKAELLFKARRIPALGFKSFYVTNEEIQKPVKRSDEGFKAAGMKAVFNTNRQFLTGFVSQRGNISVTQVLKFYKSSPHWSGAYLFGPTNNKSTLVGDRITTKLLNNGELVKEYEQVFSEWATQIIRIYQEDFAEFEWLIGPIPMTYEQTYRRFYDDCDKDKVGKEVVAVYSSEVNSGDVYYTDINGMEMEKRKRDFRNWNGKQIKSVAGNYYPVTTMISVEDDKKKMFIVVDRPQGGASLRSGEIELMIHRRLAYDDGRGVTEPLNEFAHGVGLIVRGRHWLLFGKNNIEMNRKAKLFSQERHSEPWLFFMDASSLSFNDWQTYYVNEFSGLYNYVPRNVRILTLEPWREDTVLLRLEHIFENVPSSSLSNAPVIISLRGLFKTFEIVEARETTLGADRWLSDVHRLKWHSVTKFEKKNAVTFEEIDGDLTISLLPQQIRTFIVKIKVKDKSN